MDGKIVTIAAKQDEKFLRTRTKPVEFAATGEPIIGGRALSKQETTDLIRNMRKIMQQANGIGLSANQIGLDAQLFVAQVPDTQGDHKFYAVFNPKIEKAGGGDVLIEEGCLSIPGRYGEVPRAKQVTMSGLDKNGKPIKVKAWGLLARVFQHEIDHLSGKLFIDRATETYESAPTD